jgi:hypothetical protein
LNGFGSQRTAHDGQVSGDDAPSYPFIEAVFAVIKTVIETVLALAYANSSFDACVKASAAFEPTLGFISLPLFGLAPRLG